MLTFAGCAFLGGAMLIAGMIALIAHATGPDEIPVTQIAYWKERHGLEFVLDPSKCVAFDNSTASVHCDDVRGNLTLYKMTALRYCVEHNQMCPYYIATTYKIHPTMGFICTKLGMNKAIVVTRESVVLGICQSKDDNCIEEAQNTPFNRTAPSSVWYDDFDNDNGSACPDDYELGGNNKHALLVWGGCLMSIGGTMLCILLYIEKKCLLPKRKVSPPNGVHERECCCFVATKREKNMTAVSPTQSGDTVV
jgi:hypothetical protein